MDNGFVSRITLLDGSTYAVKDAGARLSCETLSGMVQNKVTIEDKLSGIIAQTDLSIIKLSSSQYEQIAGNDKLLSNALYLIEDDYVDMFGMQVKNIAPGTSLSDAVTLQQLQEAAPTLSNYYLKSETSSAAEISTAFGNVSVDMSDYYTKAETSSAVELSASLGSKLDAEAAAGTWTSSQAYFEGSFATWDGQLYACTSAYAATSSSVPPSEDTDHWALTDMTTPDATFDIMANRLARLVGADGTLLWQQGYNLEQMLSASPADETVSYFSFSQHATSVLTLALPSVSSGKVGDFIIDISNPALGYDFLSTESYTTADYVVYNGAVYKCSTAHTGTWADADFTLTWPAFSALSTYSASTPASPVKVVSNGMLWECHTAVTAAGDWTGTANWQTASFSLPSTASYVTPRGVNVSDILTIGPGVMCELYFTLTGFTVSSKLTWKVARQDVEAVS